MATDQERPREKTVRQAMDEFLASLNAAHTQQAYATPLKHFGIFLAGQGVHVERDPATALNVDHAIDLIPWLRHEHFPEPDQPARSTLQLYLTAIYRFYRSLLKRGVAFEAADIARLEETYRDARNIRGEPRPKDPKLEAVLAIVQAARSVPPVQGERSIDRNRELSRLRDIAIVETLRSTGCRVGELVALRRGDLDWLTHSALVKGKGTKYRKVYLDDVAWRALKTYLQARRDGGDPRALARLPVFCGHGNRSGRTPSPLTTRHVSRTIQDLAERAGIAEVGMTPHYFRHVFATRALERTENLALVQDMLGHASPATTRVYAKTDERQRREGYARVWEEEEGPEGYPGDAEGGEEEWEWQRKRAFETAAPALDAVRREGMGRGDLMPAAMVELLGATGCSLEELMALYLDDVDVASRTVRFASYSDLRLHLLSRRAWHALRAYLRARPGEVGEGASCDALFLDAEGAPLSVEGAYELLLAYAAQVGMDKDELHRLL